MRIATLIALLVASGYAATSQKLTILPQAGIENSRTVVDFNGAKFSPLCMNLSPSLGVRLDYTIKSGHGLFAGIPTSRSIVSYNFSDPEAGRTAYNASPGNTRLRFEGGYQFSTKPIFFKKPSSVKKAATSSTETNAVKRSCYSSCQSRCGKTSSDSKSSLASRTKNKGWYMSIKPSAGIAFLPAISPDLTVPSGTDVNYQYKAGNYTSALVAGSGFEFGKSNHRLFTISVNYLKGIGNLGERSFISSAGTKTSVTTLQSKVSAWSITAGIPITLYKKQAVSKMKYVPAPAQKTRTESRCGQYYRRCIKL